MAPSHDRGGHQPQSHRRTQRRAQAQVEVEVQIQVVVRRVVVGGVVIGRVIVGGIVIGRVVIGRIVIVRVVVRRVVIGRIVVIVVDDQIVVGRGGVVVIVFAFVEGELPEDVSKLPEPTPGGTGLGGALGDARRRADRKLRR